MLFQNRVDAGKQLANRLQSYADRSDVLVIALPRGASGDFRYLNQDLVQTLSISPETVVSQWEKAVVVQLGSGPSAIAS